MVKWLLKISMVMFFLSFVGILFISSSFMGFGFVAFIVTFVTGISKHGFKKFPFSSEKIIPMVMLLFIACMSVVMFLAQHRGAPKLEGKPVFAKRAGYNFTRSGPDERWRFVIMLVVFHLAWHGLGIVLTSELNKSLFRKSGENA